jgi:hypothetical protein
MATSKEPIGYKLTGKKVTLVIDGETFQKTIESAEERKTLKSRVIAYNDKPLVKEKTAIKKLIKEDKIEAQKTKATAVKKVATKPSKKVQKVIEKEPELSKEEQIEQAKKLLTDNGFTIDAKPTPTTYKRGGEY